VVIGNFQGVFGNVTSSTVSIAHQANIVKGDFEALATHLRSQGLTDNDLASLKLALDQDSPPSQANVFGPKVSSWVGTMLGKAASGIWNLSVTTAANLLSLALGQFYGLTG
jgi:hypothetical protein